MNTHLNGPLPTDGLHPDEHVTVHLGITMAGAVSGGAYTAGVMDYLLDTLHRWELAKQTNREIIRQVHAREGTWEDVFSNSAGFRHDVPMHNVVVEVMGGASAGAIATVLSALRMYRGYNTIPDANHNEIRTMLFDAWVNMTENRPGNPSTFVNMLSNKDLSRKQRLLSLLNNKPLEEVKKRVLHRLTDAVLDQNGQSGSPIASFTADRMELVLTITSLRGVSVGFRFSPESPHGNDDEDTLWHEMTIHRGLAQFVFDPAASSTARGDMQVRSSDNRIRLNPYNEEHVSQLFEVALASGAFPIGLPPKPLKVLNREYITGQLDQMYHAMRPGSKLFGHMKYFVPDAPHFHTHAVDGGVMNNDPFAEVNRILKDRIPSEATSVKKHLHIPANIFIDPFPNFHKAGSENTFTEPGNILSAAGKLFGAMLNQSRYKDRHILEDFIGSGNYGMIFPSYRYSGISDKSPIAKAPLASGGFEGFIGFLNRHLREFDYYLGQRNCQSFLQKYFVVRNNYREAVKGLLLTQSVIQQDPAEAEEVERVASDPQNQDMLDDFFQRWSQNKALVDRYNFDNHFDTLNRVTAIPVIPDLSERMEPTRLPMEQERLWYIYRSHLKKTKWPIIARTHHLLLAGIRALGATVMPFELILILTVVFSVIWILLFKTIGLELWQLAYVVAIGVVLTILIYAGTVYGLASFAYKTIESELKARGQLIKSPGNSKADMK